MRLHILVHESTLTIMGVFRSHHGANAARFALEKPDEYLINSHLTLEN